MKKIFKNIVVCITVIMILLSSCVPNVVLADESPSYDGLPSGGEFNAITLTDWIVNSFKGIVDWFIGMITYVLKAVFLGWAGIIEKAIGGIFSIGTATTVEGSLTVEKIVTNQVPMLDVNFFSLSQAGGRDLDEDSVIYVIRQSIAQFYYIIRNVAIAGLLITLIYIGIRMAMSTVASTKAKYKGMLIGWLESMVLVFFIHYIMVIIVSANEWFVDMISKTMGAEEVLYDTIRSQSYAVQASIGWPATIIYILLIYLLIKFVFIYLKRFVNIAILTFLAPVIAIGFSIDKIKDGKSQSFSKWLKDYSTNVILQSVHCLLYFMFITLAFNVAGQSIFGVVLAVFLISCITQSEKLFKSIFGIEASGAPTGGLEDKPWTKLAVGTAMIKGAIKANTKMLGVISTPVRKPAKLGISKIQNAIRSNKIDKIQNSLYKAKNTGTNVITVKNSIFSKPKEYDVESLLETGEDAGYTAYDMAEMFQTQMEAEQKEKSAQRKAGLKDGYKNLAAAWGMASSIPMMAESPLLAASKFTANLNKMKRNIKGYSTGSGSYTGTIGDDIKNGMKYMAGTSGMALSIPVMAVNPLVGAAVLVASSKMRRRSLEGYNGGTGTYTGTSGTKGKIRTFATGIRDVSTVGIVPMVRQLKSNMTESEQKELTQRLTAQYRLSGQMLEDKIKEEYQKLVNNPNINKEEIDKILIPAQSSVFITNTEALKELEPPKEIKLTSVKTLATIDIDETKKLRAREGRNDIAIVRPKENVDIIDFCNAVIDYKASGMETVSEYDGFKIDSSKYKTSFEVYKDFATKGGTVEEKDVLEKLNEENKTDYNSLEEVFTDLANKKNAEDRKNGEVYVSQLEVKNESDKKELKEEQSYKEYIERIVESVTMESEAQIRKEGLAEAFTEIAQATIARWKGKKPEDLTAKETARMISSMSKEQIQEIVEIAGTKNSAVISGEQPQELKRILTLIEKMKYNDYLVNQISYDTSQAATVAEKIKKSRKRGVK